MLMSVANREVMIFNSELLKERDYWMERLSATPAASSFPPDRLGREDYTLEKSVVELRLPEAVFRDLVKLTGDSPFLIYTTLLAAVKICLHKYSGNRTIIVGSPALKDLGKVNSLAIVSEIDAEITFRQFLLNLRGTLLEAYERQSYPFHYLMRDLGLEDAEGDCLFFDLVVTLKDMHGNVPELNNGITITIENRTDGISGLIEFSPALYSQAAITVFADHLVSVVQEALENKDKRLADFVMLTAEERQRLIVEWNQTETEYSELCFHQLFEAQVERTPQAVALQTADRKLTYDELNVRANQLAHFLRRQGVGPEVPVGICMARSVEMIVAVLAVLKAGGGYVPLDPEYPLEWLRYVMEDVGAPIVLTQSTLAERLPAIWGQVICVDDESETLTPFPEYEPLNNVLLDSPAYVIYTSGSTGRPKGVVVTHRGLCNVAAAQSRILGIQPESRVLQFASLSFDASIFEMLMAWGTGGLLSLVPQNSLPLGKDLQQLLTDHAVTTVTLPPTALATLPIENFPDLSTITVAGEACPAELVERWAPGRRFFNLYGPTEATIWATAAECLAGDRKPLIGRAIDNVQTYILDERQEPVPIGAVGELYIGGAGLARGYWGRADLTAERFVPHPFSSTAGSRLYRTGDLARFRADGQIDFLGRLDHQIKMRGFRIELGEIEAVLRQYSGVADTVVVVREDRPEEKRIVAYIVSQSEVPPNVSELLDFLKQKLPEFMMPQAFVVLDHLPLTPSGKIDRRQLDAPDSSRPNLEGAFVEPAGAAEQTLARIWSEVLRVQSIGTRDNFFALGGDSILAMQVVARANQAGLRLLPKHLFEHQTIAELALVAGTAPVIEAEQGLVTGPVPLTPIQHWFFEQKSPEPNQYNQSVMLEVHQKLDQSLLKQVVQQLLAHHDALRLRYSEVDGSWQQLSTDGNEPLPFEDHDLSELTDEQQTTILEQQANALQASLNLQDGPLVRVALFEMGPEKPARLLIIIHHLVVDGVSWRIILEHLQTGYEQARRGELIDFGEKTTSFKYWSERLAEYASSNALETQKSYWLTAASGEALALPVDHSDGANTIESAQQVRIALNAEETEALLHDVPAAYNTQINDVLLTAVVQAFYEWTGKRTLLVSLEGHGREDVVENVDVSRTVGWFTTEFPVLLTSEGAKVASEALPLIKEQLRAIPQRGIGYGLLRYLSDDDQTREQLSKLSQPDVSFNYLGQFDQVLSESALFRIASESRGQNQSQRYKLPYLLQISGSIMAGRLYLNWTYSKNVFLQTTVERLSDSFLKALQALIAHCQSPEAGGFTPSDFPLARLTQSELDRVAGRDRGIEDIYPLSPFQQGLLFHKIYAPQSGAYFTQLSGTIEQQLNVVAFKSAWQRVVDRHSILRTAFVWEGVREPLQVVRKQVALPWVEFDWRALSASEQATQLELFLKADQERDFVFSEAPVMRATLVRLADDSYRFIWSLHHLLLDGWALFRVIKEVFSFYEAFAEGRELSLEVGRPFRGYIAWLQQQDQLSEEKFWRAALKGFSSPTPLVVERPSRGPKELEEDYFDQRFSLSSTTTQALQSLARKHQLTLNTIVQGCYALLMSRYSGENDVVFGATVAGRPPTLAGVESMIGIFINTLPVRVRIAPEDRLLPWLKRLQERQAEAQQYEYSPLVQVQGWSDVPRGQPLFESILLFENFPVDDSLKQQQASLNLKDVRSLDKANYSLAVGASPGQQLRFRFSYDRRRFEDETITRMFGHLQTLLEGVVADPEQRVADLPLLTPAEQEQVLVEWNQTAAPYPAHLCLHHLFEAQVLRTPQAVALHFAEAQLSYAELNGRANQLAHFLRQQGVGPEALVGICMERSVEMVVAMLAVLKAGGAYVPLDPAYPLERLRYMMEEINSWVVLTQTSVAERLPAHWGQVVCVDEEWETLASFPRENPQSDVNSDNLANLIFTSGSTGVPKASMVTHRGLCNAIVSRVEALSLTETDRLLQTTSFSFDASVWEFFAPLAIGAQLILLRPGGHQQPAYIVSMLDKHQVTIVEMPPSWLQVVLQEPGLDQCDQLKHVICGGQIMTGELQEQFFARLHANLHNFYGPSEASIDATSWTCEPDSAQRTVPIGRPITNVQVYLLDSQLSPVPVGVPGELHIGGVGLARGYLNQPQTTAEKFIPNPFSETPGSRLYKTGDLARYLESGVIEFCGRNDDQVKIRGFRIELGEIEAVLVQHEKVLEAALVVREDTPGDKRLVAYIGTGTKSQPTVDELRAFMVEKLPAHMAPAFFVMLDVLPRSLNGKVDRQALPVPDQSRPQLETPHVAPRNPVEQKLADIWAEVLGVEQVGIDDNFFALGGDSIRSVQVLSRAQQRGVSFSLQDIFQHQTIRRLAQEITPTEDSTEVILKTQPFSMISSDDREQLPADVEDAYPLTMLQAGMIFHSDYHPESAIYHSISSRRIRAKLDIQALQIAVGRIVDQHPALRTSFHLNGFSQPLQLVHRSVRVLVTEDDLRQLQSAERERVVAQWLEAEKVRHFVWTQAPLFRLHIHRCTEETFQFTFTAHHSLLDGWSDSLFFAELFKRYVTLLKGEAEPETVAPSIPYREFVWLERQALESEETRNFWHDKLSDSVIGRLPRLPANDREAGAEPLSRFGIPVDSVVSDGLKRITQLTGIPIKNVLLAAHMKVMSLLNGQPDVMTGLVSNGRPEATDGERIVGLFLNTLPFRMELPQGSWIDLVRKVFDTEKEMLPHRRYPLAQIQRDQGGHSLFETAFNFTQFHLYQGLQDVTEVQVLDSISVAETNFTMMVNFAVGIATNQIQAVIDCNPEELGEDEMRAIVGYYTKTLEAMAANPESEHESSSLLSATELQQLLREWNDTATDYPRHESLHELFAEQVKRDAEAVALISGDVEISYGELNSRANQLAHHLQRLGVGPEVIVGLCLERSVEMVVGLLGILKAGGAYLPLDPQYPLERLHFMLEDAGLHVLLTQQHLKERFPLEQLEVVCLDTDWERIARQEPTNPGGAARAENLAYVIYTSGSTGQPKGVAIEHRSAIALINWAMAVFSATELAGVLASTSICFDLSIFELFAPLSCGGKVIMAENALQLPELPAAGEVTLINTVPSAMTELVGMKAVPESVRTVNLAGEPLQGLLVQRIYQQESIERVLNLYGPSEDTTYSTWATIDRGLMRQPTIGRPIANGQAYVLDGHRQPVPVGVAGELYLGGAGVARGYLNRPELTAQSFVPDSFSEQAGARLYRTGDLARYLPGGEIEFLGRVDHQVKIRGFRIELGEIEVVLAQHPFVREAVVSAREDTPGEKRLVAYVVAEPSTEPTTSELRRYLKEKLPERMVPLLFVLLDQFPLTPNGKVDRRALPRPELESRVDNESATASRMPVEDLLAGIWSEVLGRERVEVTDNFFELGGHSLLATQVISRVRAAFQTEIPLRSLFEMPTLAAFAASVQMAFREKQGLSVPPITRVARDISLPLSFAQQRLWIVEQLVSGAPVYHLPAAVRLKGQLNIEALEQSLNEIVRRHETLRTSFALLDGKPVQVIAPDLTLPLPLVDLSESAETNREAEARQLANEWLQTPFDLLRGPLLRVSLLRMGPEEHIALFVIHHIISDGWSMGVLISEIATLYEAFAQGRPSPLLELPVQYADFASWQRAWLQGDMLELQLDYWRNQLGRQSPELLLPIDRPRPPVQTHRGAHQSFAVSGEIQRRLSVLSRREGVTMFMTLLAAFQTLLFRYSSQEDIVVGTDLANRNRAETEHVIGFFVNMLVLRTDLSGNPNFRELLGRVREVALGAYAHQDLPFEKLVDELEPNRDPSRNPLFQAVFVLQNTPAQELKLPGLSLSPFRIESNTVQFDLILSMSESKDALAGVIAYNTDLFDGSTISEMISRFQNLLQLIVENPDERIADLRLISDTAADGFTLSDFPRADLSQKDFESLLSQLGETAESVT
jgi:amino acid adenylation domain-containing protein/non-ribosomal peptide synthase protein (TIGR01720 family)